MELSQASFAIAFFVGPGPFFSSSYQSTCTVWISFQPQGRPYRWFREVLYLISTFCKSRGNGEMLIWLNGSNHPKPGYADLTECCENPSEGGMDKVEFLGWGGTGTQKRRKGQREVIESCFSKGVRDRSRTGTQIFSSQLISCCKFLLSRESDFDFFECPQKLGHISLWGD